MDKVPSDINSVKQNEPLIKATLVTIGGSTYEIEFPAKMNAKELIISVLPHLGLPASQLGTPLHYVIEFINARIRLGPGDLPGELALRYEDPKFMILTEPRAG